MAAIGDIVEHLRQAGRRGQLVYGSAQPVGHVGIVGLDDRQVNLAALTFGGYGLWLCDRGRRRALQLPLLQHEGAAADFAYHQAALGSFVVSAPDGAGGHVQGLGQILECRQAFASHQPATANVLFQGVGNHQVDRLRQVAVVRNPHRNGTRICENAEA